MSQEKVSVAARISKDLYTKCLQDYGTISNAIVAGLELLYDESRKQNVNKDDIYVNDSKLLDEKDIRIEELKDQIQELYTQLHTKDTQIDKINENMQAQAIHLQTLLNQKAIEAPGVKKWWKFW